jgi:hypothetical protein
VRREREAVLPGPLTGAVRTAGAKDVDPMLLQPAHVGAGVTILQCDVCNIYMPVWYGKLKIAGLKTVA